MAARRRRGKKRLTLRQKLLVVSLVSMGIASAVSYTLAAFDHDTASDVTIALIGLFGAGYTAYVTADTFDHNSINKYGKADADGDE